MVDASFGCLRKVRTEMNRMSTNYLEARHLLVPVKHDILRGLSEMT